jgi:hypothetical protein
VITPLFAILHRREDTDAGLLLTIYANSVALSPDPQMVVYHLITFRILFRIG